jgi:hypothetical protein
VIATERLTEGDTVPQLRTRKMPVARYDRPARLTERFSAGFHTILLYFGDSEMNYAVGINVVYSTYISHFNSKRVASKSDLRALLFKSQTCLLRT